MQERGDTTGEDRRQEEHGVRVAGPGIFLLCSLALLVLLKFCEPTDYVSLPSKILVFTFLLIALDVLQGKINKSIVGATPSLPPCPTLSSEGAVSIGLSQSFSSLLFKLEAAHYPRYPHKGLASEQPRGQDSRYMLR